MTCNEKKSVLGEKVVKLRVFSRIFLNEESAFPRLSFSLSFRFFFGGRAVLKKPGLPGILCTVVACPRISNLLLSTYCCFLPDCIAIHTKLF